MRHHRMLRFNFPRPGRGARARSKRPSPRNLCEDAGTPPGCIPQSHGDRWWSVFCDTTGNSKSISRAPAGAPAAWRIALEPHPGFGNPLLAYRWCRKERSTTGYTRRPLRGQRRLVHPRRSNDNPNKSSRSEKKSSYSNIARRSRNQRKPKMNRHGRRKAAT